MALSPGKQVLMQRRPPSGIWGGLWTLPVFDDDRQLEAAVAVALAVTMKGSADGQAKDHLPCETLPTVHHALTHLDWTLESRRLRVTDQEAAQAMLAAVAQALSLSAQSGTAPSADAQLCWMGLQEALACGLPSPIRVLLQAQAAAPG
jgi:A/G-specific adenine glycosylase